MIGISLSEAEKALKGRNRRDESLCDLKRKFIFNLIIIKKKMVKREVNEYKQIFQEIKKFTFDALNPKQKRIYNTSDKTRVKMPYKMFSNMKAKTLEKWQKEKQNDKDREIIAESGRSTKMMQKVFISKELQKKKDKLMQHQRPKFLHKKKVEQVGRFKDGMLTLSKRDVNKLTKEEPEDKFSKFNKGNKRGGKMKKKF